MISFQALPGSMQGATYNLKRTGFWGTEDTVLYADSLSGEDASGSQCVLSLLLL